MKHHSKTNTMLFSLFTVAEFTEEMLNYMLSKDNRLATIEELGRHMYHIEVNYFIDLGYMQSNRETETATQTLFRRIFESVDFIEMSRMLYRKLYNTAMLQRVVDVAQVNKSVAAELEQLYTETENQFFKDENLEILFERIKDFY